MVVLTSLKCKMMSFKVMGNVKIYSKLLILVFKSIFAFLGWDVKKNNTSYT